MEALSKYKWGFNLVERSPPDRPLERVCFLYSAMTIGFVLQEKARDARTYSTVAWHQASINIFDLFII